MVNLYLKYNYQGKKSIVDSLLWVPAFRQRDAILVLSREPAGERIVRGPPASVLPELQIKNLLHYSICPLSL